MPKAQQANVALTPVADLATIEQVVSTPTRVLSWRTSQEPSQQLGRATALVLGAIVLIGLLQLAQPFFQDQAFFTIGAEAMNRGRVLYRDFWDIKQPGIFVFYLVAGKLFGFREIGIHLFELLYMTALSVVLIRTCRHYYKVPVLSVLAPLLTVGVYYAVAGVSQTGQVESLAGFPLFLCLWFAHRATRDRESGARNFFLCGLMGGMALLLKLMFLPIVLCFALSALMYVRRKSSPAVLVFPIRHAGAFVAGVLLPLLAMTVYFGLTGAMGIAFYTFLVYPLRAITHLPPAGASRLNDGMQWFLYHFAPELSLAFIGAWWSWKRSKDFLTVNLVLWLGAGAVVVLLQCLSWWRYHYMLFFVPLGLLATKGIDEICQLFRGAQISPWRAGRVASILAMVLLFSPMLSSLGLKTLSLARHGFAIGKEHRLEYQGRFPEAQYQNVLAEVSFLSQPESLAGDIYVVGHPLYYFLSGRQPAIALNGSGIEIFLPEQWRSLSSQLRQARPVYIFISALDRNLFQTGTPESVDFIAQNYRVLRTDSIGTWYVRLP
jgi:hypothetical protein